MNRFTNRRVLITGGTSGIGLATAQAFAREGASVAITGRDSKSLADAKASLPAGTLAIRSDAGSLKDINDLVSQLASFGSIDAVFINAGIAKFAPLESINVDLWDDIFDTNVKGPYFLIQKLTSLLSPKASIVLNGSINARIGMPNSSVYAASKAALISLAKTLSAELLPRGVRVNVVSPGPVATPIYGKLGLDEKTLEATAAGILNQIPLGRFGQSEEIASTVLHLAADESSFIVGTEIIVDGGMSQL